MNTINLLTQELKSFAAAIIVALPKIVFGILVAAFFILVGKRFAALVIRRIKDKNGRSTTNLLILLEKGFRLLFVGIGVFIGLSIIVPSLKFSDLFTLLGVGGVAVGFAFRDILQNFFAGIIILLTRTFEVGDRITSTGIDGTVEEISMRTTIVRTDIGDRIIVPNSLLMTREIGHRFYSEKGKMTVLFYVPIDAHLEAVIRLAKDIFREMGSAIDPPRSKIIFESMTERTIVLRATWRTNQVPPSPRASKEYFVTRLQEELHRYGAHLGLLEEFTVRSYDGGMEKAISLSRNGSKPPEKSSPEPSPEAEQ